MQSHVITCAYLNSDGHSAEKMLAIELETDNDRDVMITECNFTPSDHSRLTLNMGEWSEIVACNEYTYSAGVRAIPRGGTKLSGFGTAVVTKNKTCMKRYVNLDRQGERKFEILALDVEMSDVCREGRVIVYRSPSMKCDVEIKEFYERVHRYFEHMRDSGKFQCLTYVGDPNKNAKAVAKREEAKVMAKFRMRNLIGAQKTRVRGGSETQPDSCYAWFDPAAVVVTATVNGKIHRLMDHRLIRMRYQIKGLVPREREFYEFEREIRNKDIKHTDICERLNDEVNKWIHTYGGFVFKTMGRDRNEWVEFDEDDNVTVSEDILNRAVDI